MDAESAKKLMRLDELIEKSGDHTDAEWDEFRALAAWQRDIGINASEALRKEWHRMKIDSLVAGGLQ